MKRLPWIIAGLVALIIFTTALPELRHRGTLGWVQVTAFIVGLGLFVALLRYYLKALGWAADTLADQSDKNWANRGLVVCALWFTGLGLIALPVALMKRYIFRKKEASQ